MSKSTEEIQTVLTQFSIPKPQQTEEMYEKLGYKDAIPYHLPYFVMTNTARTQSAEMASRMKIGKKLKGLKVIGWYGPPGTGKNTLAKEIAATLRMPYREFDLGQGFDLMELIGGTLQKQNFVSFGGAFNQKTPFICPQRNPIGFSSAGSVAST